MDSATPMPLNRLYPVTSKVCLPQAVSGAHLDAVIVGGPNNSAIDGVCKERWWAERGDGEREIYVPCFAAEEGRRVERASAGEGGISRQTDWLKDDGRRAREEEPAAGGGVWSSGDWRMRKMGFL
jgi:hypothetical protein